MKDHEDLIDILSSVQGSVVVSGYACKTYECLEKMGFMRYEREVFIRSSASRTKRVECIWVK